MGGRARHAETLEASNELRPGTRSVGPGDVSKLMTHEHLAKDGGEGVALSERIAAAEAGGAATAVVSCLLTSIDQLEFATVDTLQFAALMTPSATLPLKQPFHGFPQ